MWLVGDCFGVDLVVGGDAHTAVVGRSITGRLGVQGLSFDYVYIYFDHLVQQTHSSLPIKDNDVKR